MIRFKSYVMRVCPRGIISDPDGWSVEVCGVWLARFSENWRAQHAFRWGFGVGKRTWFYYPKSASCEAGHV